jgi:hypothetical protein
MRLQTLINGVEGVTAGGVASVNIPIGRRYHGLKIFATGTDGTDPYTDPADIVARCRLIVNGVVMRDLTPAQIRAIATLNGQTVGNNEIPIFFSEPWRASITGEEATSWDMTGQTKFTLEIEIKSGVTTPACKVLAAYDFGRNVSDGKPFLSIVKQLSYNYNAPSGEFEIVSLPTRYPISRVLLTASTGTISKVEVYRDSQKVLEATAAENTRILADYGLDASKWTYPVVFDPEQQVSSALLIAREMNLRVTSSAANTLTAVLEHRANGFA